MKWRFPNTYLSDPAFVAHFQSEVHQRLTTGNAAWNMVDTPKERSETDGEGAGALRPLGSPVWASQSKELALSAVCGGERGLLTVWTAVSSGTCSST